MAMVARFNLELYQIVVRTAFLNDDLYKDVYVTQPMCFKVDGKKPSIGVLGRYLSDPGTSHWRAAKKVLRYLQVTKDLMLTYRQTNTLDIVDFCDVDFGGCVDNKKSTIGYIFIMDGGAISYKSVK
ncbi:hypothetical protein UlMin_035511 [Ulmus minor]